MTRFTSFVMLAGMRTGSNLLEERLNALEGLRCHGEAFNPAFLGVPEAEVLLGIDRATREAQPEALLDALRAARGLNGFRLFEGHDARVMDAVLDDPLCAKIVLTRDPLDSYLSLAIARRTGQWKLTGPKGAKAATVPFEAEAFAAHLAGVEAHLAMIRRRLQTTGQAAFWIDYTELSDAEVLAGLAGFLGVPPAVPAATTLKPQNPSPAREKVANPEEMEAALRRYGRFDPGASPDLEARRGAMVPRLVAGVEAPLLYLPIGSGPDAEVLRWLAALDGRPVEALRVNLTRRDLRDWQAARGRIAAMAVLRHPVARAHEAFARRILADGEGAFDAIRDRLVRHHGLILPGAGDETAEAEAFKTFLRFLRQNLSGRTGIRVPPDWASQEAMLRGYAEHLLPDAVVREDEMEEALPALAARLGVAADGVAPPRPAAAPALERVYDAEVEALTRAAYGRDYLRFGFGDWRA